MPILLAAITVIIQACFIYHVFKTRRPYWWAFIILSFPVIGCIVYYFVEVFPGTQEARKAEKFAKAMSQRIGGDQDFARRIEETEICGSVDNKIALAQECMQRGLHDDAARLYRNCLQGLYADDPHLLLGLASALVEQQQFSEARSALERLQERHPEFKVNDAALLHARVLEGGGDSAGALRAYEALIPLYVGLEARYRHALLLKQTGRGDQASAALVAMLEHARKHRVKHEDELAWLNRAKKELQN